MDEMDVRRQLILEFEDFRNDYNSQGYDVRLNLNISYSDNHIDFYGAIKEFIPEIAIELIPAVTKFPTPSEWGPYVALMRDSGKPSKIININDFNKIVTSVMDTVNQYESMGKNLAIRKAKKLDSIIMRCDGKKTGWDFMIPMKWYQTKDKADTPKDYIGFDKMVAYYNQLKSKQ